MTPILHHATISCLDFCNSPTTIHLYTFLSLSNLFIAVSPKQSLYSSGMILSKYKTY